MAQQVKIIIQWDARQAQKAITDLAKWIDKNFWRIQQESKKTANTIFTTTNALRALASSFVIRWITNLWWEMLRLWSDLEQTRVAFETLTWSVDTAKWLLEELVQFSAKTPFELPWVQKLARQLLAFGFSVDELIPNMRVLGDITAWIWVDKLPQLTLAFWQVRTAWRLMWTELRQFTEAWVPLIDELAKSLWVAKSEIQDMVSRWEIWFRDVQKALQNLTSEWWRFNNLMEKQSQTLGWLASTAKDTFQIMLANLAWVTLQGELMEDWLAMNAKNMLKSMTNFMETNTKNFQIMFKIFTDSFSSLADNVFEIANNMLWSFSSFFQETLEGWESMKVNMIDIFKWIALAVDALFTQINKGISTIHTAVVWFSSAIDFIFAWSNEEARAAAKNFDKALNWLFHTVEKFDTWLEDRFNKIADTYSWAWFNIAQGLARWLPDVKKEIEDFVWWDIWGWWSSSWKKWTLKSVENMLKAIQKEQEDYVDTFRDIKSESRDAYERVNSDIDSSINKIQWLVEQYNDLKWRIRDIKQEVKDIQAWWAQDIAWRFIELNQSLKEWAKRIVEIQDELRTGWDNRIVENRIELQDELNKLFDEQKKIQDEIALARANITDEDIRKSEEEASKSITQRMLEEISTRKMAALERQTELEFELEQKRNAIVEEKEAYENLIQTKQNLDNAYFETFREQIRVQISEIESAIERMNELRWTIGVSPQAIPTLWQTTNNSFNVNGMTVWSNIDQAQLLHMVGDFFTRQSQLAKLWIN